MRPFLLGTALAAVWLTLSRLHRLHSSDSLIFSLASLYEWTPFFWEQDRVGMLLPLLASPVRHPLANQLVITGVMSFCGLLTPLLMTWLVYPRRHAYAAVTLGNALFVLLAPDILHENMLVVCNYPLGLVLGLTAVKLLDAPTAGRAVVALVLLLLAHWVYIGVAVFLSAFLGCRWLVERSRGTFFAGVRAGAGTVAAATVLLALMAAWRGGHPEISDTPSDGRPISEWLDGVLGFLTTLADLPGFAVWAAAVVGVGLVGVGAAVIRDRADAGRAARAALPLLLAVAAELCFLSSRFWTAANLYHSRYLVAVVTAAWVVVAVTASVTLAGEAVRRWVTWASILALLATVAVRHGPPSVTAARTGLEQATGSDSEDVLASGYEGIGGEYMWAWPAVYHTNLVLYERGERRTVVGVASRSAPWVWRWKAGELAAGFRIAAPFDQEEQARKWIGHYGLNVTAGPERHGRLIVFTVRPAGE